MFNVPFNYNVNMSVEGGRNPHEKKRRGRPRKEKEVSSNVRGEELIASLMESELEGESETEIDVRRIKINGKEYLISEEGVLYDKESHEEVGRWNASRGMIEE